MEREVGGGIGMGNTCKPMAVSFQCMTKYKKKNKIKAHLTSKKKKKNAEIQEKMKTTTASGRGELRVTEVWVETIHFLCSA